MYVNLHVLDSLKQFLFHAPLIIFNTLRYFLHHCTCDYTNSTAGESYKKHRIRKDFSPLFVLIVRCSLVLNNFPILN